MKLCQVVTIPSDMEDPTFTFSYYWPSNYWLKTEQFTLTIQEGDNSQVISYWPTLSSRWDYQGIDLSAYRGKTINLEFELRQISPYVGLVLYLDEISLGPASVGTRHMYFPAVQR